MVFICILGGIGTAGVPAGSLPVVAMILGHGRHPGRGDRHDPRRRPLARHVPHHAQRDRRPRGCGRGVARRGAAAGAPMPEAVSPAGVRRAGGGRRRPRARHRAGSLARRRGVERMRRWWSASGCTTTAAARTASARITRSTYSDERYVRLVRRGARARTGRRLERDSGTHADPPLRRRVLRPARGRPRAVGRRGGEQRARPACERPARRARRRRRFPAVRVPGRPAAVLHDTDRRRGRRRRHAAGARPALPRGGRARARGDARAAHRSLSRPGRGRYRPRPAARRARGGDRRGMGRASWCRRCAGTCT